MQDFSLSDLGWIVGGLITVSVFVVVVRAVFDRRAQLAAWIMSRDGSPPDRASPQTEPRPPVLQPQYQNAPNQSVNFDAVLSWVIEHNVTEEQGIALIAGVHRAPGDYFLSANKIRDGVGGSRDEILSQVAAIRPKPPAPKIAAHLDRPVKGW